MKLSAAQRLEVGQFIVNFEARRDAQGKLRVYRIPPKDGGGKYEVAGINDRYHPDEVAALRALIVRGRHAEAERRAVGYIATYTDGVAVWSPHAAVEAFLRDCAFNRGPKGAAMILQLALGVKVDGWVGGKTMAAVAAVSNVPALLILLRAARERYERRYVGRDESSDFWKGLVNRWDKAVKMAEGYL